MTHASPDQSPWFVIVTKGTCDDCGATPSAIDTYQLGPRIAEEAQNWDALLNELAGDPVLRTRPAANVWSPLEYAVHARDTLQVFLDRTRLALAVTEPHFAYQDQDELVVAAHYNQQDPRTIGRALRDVGAEFSAVLGSLPRHVWARGGRRLPGERFDIADLARFAWHELSHHRHDAQRSASHALVRAELSQSVFVAAYDESAEDSIYAAYAAAVDTGEAFPRHSPTTRATFRKAWLHDKTSVFVARTRAAGAVGSYWLRPNFPERAAHIANAAYVVAQDHQRRGVGRLLVLHSLEEARLRGYDAMMFNLVLAQNPAVPLYEECGFTELGRIPSAVAGTDALILWRALN
jgi:ribosomal protein S18 acetylase RimI-like enzyme